MYCPALLFILDHVTLSSEMAIGSKIIKKKIFFFLAKLKGYYYYIYKKQEGD